MDNPITYAVGDIHGRLDLLEALVAAIESEATSEVLIVFLGDYVDRGPDSREVLDYLIEGSRRRSQKWVLLRGNHEQMFLNIILQPSPANWSLFLSNGGGGTLRSYGIQNADAQEVLERVPWGHFEFLAGLPLTFDDGIHLFVHAGIDPNAPLLRQGPETFLWIRNEFLNSSSDFNGRRVIHGHNISHLPVVKRNRIGVDTGAYRNGRLTAVRLPVSDGIVSFIQAVEDGGVIATQTFSMSDPI